nr:HNH endonuclease signature motif containing protein [Rhodococcus sp. (in: high G+C Gram-positive bacteria)]
MAWKNGTTRERDPEFIRNRPQVLKRDRAKCQLAYGGICIVKATEVDHIKNVKRGGGNGLDNLQAVCVECHKRKTWSESYEARMQTKRDSRHPDSLRKHPGLR